MPALHPFFCYLSRWANISTPSSNPLPSSCSASHPIQDRRTTHPSSAPGSSRPCPPRQHHRIRGLGDRHPRPPRRSSRRPRPGTTWRSPWVRTANRFASISATSTPSHASDKRGPPYKGRLLQKFISIFWQGRCNRLFALQGKRCQLYEVGFFQNSPQILTSTESEPAKCWGEFGIVNLINCISSYFNQEHPTVLTSTID